MVMFCLLLLTQHKPKALCGEELHCDMLCVVHLEPFQYECFGDFGELPPPT